MGMPVRIDDTLYEQARAQAQAERRTIAGQMRSSRTSAANMHAAMP